MCLALAESAFVTRGTVEYGDVESTVLFTASDVHQQLVAL